MDSEVARLVERWDENAPYRFDELTSGVDSAYEALLGQFLSRVVRRAPPGSDLVDIGCGVGVLSAALARAGFRVLALDPSAASLNYARGIAAERGVGVVFLQETVEDLPRSWDSTFDVAVANMTLHCTPSLQLCLAATCRLLRLNASLLVALPNPATYLQTRQDIDLSGVNLDSEVVLEVPFRIRDQRSHPRKVLYYHRPLTTYLETAHAVGLQLEEFDIPDKIGPGRPRDTIFLHFCRAPA